MSSALLLVVAAAAGITYEWREVNDAQGGHEYVVTVEPTLMQAAVDGAAKTFESNVPAHVEKVRRVVVVMGEGHAESVQDLVSEKTGKPQLHNVARPDFHQEAKRHTVRQQGYYPTQNDIERGFENQRNAASAERRSIGSELRKGTRKLVDETGRVLRDTGDILEGTARNTRDRVRSVLVPGGNQPPATAQPTPTGGYQPFNYNNPAPPYPAATPTAGGTSPVNYNPPNYNPANANPPLPATTATPTGVQPTWGNNPAANPPRPQGQWTSEQPTAPPAVAPPSPYPPAATGGGNPYNTAGGNNAPPLPATGNNSSYVGFGDQRGNAVGNSNDMAPLTPPARDYRQPTNQPPQQPHFPPPNDSNWPQPPRQPNTPDPDRTAGTGAADTWGNWPSPPATPVSNPPAGTPRQTGYTPGPGAGQNPGEWGAPIGGQGTNNPPQQPLDNQAATQPKYPWLTLISIAAFGSFAWNFWLGMNYIDARNKYRAALRRSGKAYSDAYDDA